MVVALMLAGACGDDKGGATEASMSGETPATEASASATQASATGAGTDAATEPTGAATDDPTGGGGAMFCQEECSVDADCKENGDDFGFKCVDKRCTVEIEKCTGELDCQAQASAWTMPCASSADCGTQVCIEVEGEGRCALVPSDVIMCDVYGFAEVTRPSFPEAQDVTVCAAVGYECRPEGYCFNPCESDTDCENVTGFPKCDVGAGTCGCSSDDDCKVLMQPSRSTCHDGVCGCGKDADCEGAGGDLCLDGGLCGCSSADACTNKSFDGTVVLCAG